MGWFGDILKDTGKAMKWLAPAALAPLTGGASLAAYGAYGANSANKANLKSVDKQMAFQERMSSTEMQRRVDDLKAAGLNPMLAGANQQGASSAQGARTEIQSPIAAAVNSAMAMRMQKAQLDNMTLQNRVLEEQALNVQADTTLKYSSANAAYGSFQQSMRAAERIHYEIENLKKDYNLKDIDIAKGNLTLQQLKEMQPLAIEAQRLSNALQEQARASGEGLEELRKNPTYRDIEAFIRLYRGQNK